MAYTTSTIDKEEQFPYAKNDMFHSLIPVSPALPLPLTTHRTEPQKNREDMEEGGGKKTIKRKIYIDPIFRTLHIGRDGENNKRV